MPQPPANSPESPAPYVGLRAFTEQEAPLFFGREREKIELARLVASDTVSILYGVSGVGKSSLLNAGLFPRLRERDYLPVRLRLDHDESAPALTVQLQRAVHAAAAAAGVEIPGPREGESLWEFFHDRARAEFWTDDHRLLNPALALDQFEEFFSLGHEGTARRERSAAFRGELLDLLTNNVPPHARDVPGQYVLAAAATPRCLLILREDFISQLLPIVDSLAEQLPGIHRQKLRLLPLDDDAAREVIAGPARAQGLEEPDEATARAILKLATPPGGSGVEPARLALLLSALEAERRARGLPRIDAELASRADADLFTRFVDGTLADQPEAARHFVEEELVTPAGYRRDATADQAADAGVAEGTLETLRERRLLTARVGRPVRYELSHDLLCPPLRRSREGRHARQISALAQARVRRAWAVAGVAVTVAAVAVAVVVFALFARAEAERERQRADAEKAQSETARAEAEKEKRASDISRVEAERQKSRAIVARKDAEGLIDFMQYDLRDTLGKVGRLDMMEHVLARIRRYQEEHPADTADQAAFDAAERERASSLDQQGDILVARGQLDAGLKCYQEGLVITRRLAAQDSGNVLWQRDLSVSLNKVGGVQRDQGNLVAALKNYQDSTAIRAKLAALDPGDAGRQRDLAVVFNDVGDVQQAQRDLPAALKSNQESLAICLRLTAQDSGSASLQRDLAVSYSKVGDVQQAQGDLPEALKSYRDSFAIRARLVAQDPGNVDLQRDLSVILDNIGDVLQFQSDLPAALQTYQDALAIAAKLAAIEPGNAGWQRDLALCQLNVGMILSKQDKKSDARERFERDREIVDRLAAAHPGDYSVETDRAFARWELATCYDTAQPDGKNQARRLLREAATILHGLEKSPGLQPKEAGWLLKIESGLATFDR